MLSMPLGTLLGMVLQIFSVQFGRVQPSSLPVPTFVKRGMCVELFDPAQKVRAVPRLF